MSEPRTFIQRLYAQFVHHWTVRDGLVARFQQTTDTAQTARLIG